MYTIFYKQILLFCLLTCINTCTAQFDRFSAAIITTYINLCKQHGHNLNASGTICWKHGVLAASYCQDTIKIATIISSETNTPTDIAETFGDSSNYSTEIADAKTVMASEYVTANNTHIQQFSTSCPLIIYKKIAGLDS